MKATLVLLLPPVLMESGPLVVNVLPPSVDRSLLFPTQKQAIALLVLRVVALVLLSVMLVTLVLLLPPVLMVSGPLLESAWVSLAIPSSLLFPTLVLEIVLLI